MADEYTIHPACAKWPRPSDAEFEALVEDIKTNSQQVPIIATYANEILDGKLRYEACMRLGLEPDIETYGFDDEASCSNDKCIALTISANKHRRHMTLAQLAFIGEELAKLHNGTNQHQKKVGRVETRPTSEIASQAKIAQQLGIDTRAIGDVRAIKKYGEPNVVELAETGQVGLKNAACYARHTPRDEQRNADRETVKHQGNRMRTPLKNKKISSIKFSSEQLEYLNEKLRPLIKRLRFQSKQHITLLCPYELECIAFEIDAFLKGWANTEAKAASPTPAASVTPVSGNYEVN